MLPNGEAYYKAIKTKTRILTLPNREAYCKAIKTKTLWSWNRVKKQIKGTEYSEKYTNIKVVT